MILKIVPRLNSCGDSSLVLSINRDLMINGFKGKMIQTIEVKRWTIFLTCMINKTICYLVVNTKILSKGSRSCKVLQVQINHKEITVILRETKVDYHINFQKNHYQIKMIMMNHKSITSNSSHNLYFKIRKGCPSKVLQKKCLLQAKNQVALL